MSLEQIAKSMEIAFLALIDQLPEVGHFITSLEMVDITTDLYLQPLALSQREKLLQGISLLGVRVQLKQRRINSVLLTARVLRCMLASKGYFLHLHSIWSINAQWNVVYLLMGHIANFA